MGTILKVESVVREDVGYQCEFDTGTQVHVLNNHAPH